MNAMRTGISRDISAEMESRKALLKSAGEITAKVFSAAREQLLAYTQSPEYPELLEASARRLAPLFEADDGRCWSRRRTSPMPTGCAVFGRPCEVRESDEIRIGGLKAFSEEALGACWPTENPRFPARGPEGMVRGAFRPERGLRR